MGNSDLASLPTAAIVAIIGLVVLQVGLQVWGLIDLWRRDRVMFGRKWVWLLIILFGEIIGVVIYLAVGRNVPQEVADPLAQTPSADTDRVERAADTLYGQR